MFYKISTVGGRGLEPPRLAALVPKTSVSTISPPAHTVYFATNISSLRSEPDKKQRSLLFIRSTSVSTISPPQHTLRIIAPKL